MLRVSQTKCHRVAWASVATTAWTWARKSASVRLGEAGRGHDLSRHHIPTHDEGPCPMTNVLKFTPLHFSRSQRESRLFAFERLHAGQLIRADRPLSLLGHLRGLLIDLTDLPNRFLFVRI